MTLAARADAATRHARDDGRVPTPDSAALRAHTAIRAAILDGTHRPGEMLSENELAQGLGMSRTPVRSALTRLQDEGWITIYPKRGALVRALSDREIAELADARLILEAMGVQRASTEVRRALADRLEPQLDAQRRALLARDLDGFVTLTIAFHRSFVEAAGNAVLAEIADRLTDRQRLLLSAHRETLFERVEETVAEHRSLIERLRADDPAGFAAALRGHLMDTHGPELGPV
ncbi:MULTISPECIES: GntR family transcriptional regulator [Agromyces]|uniref:GntR family transcriptional regulator n=1 Tax=Agromyces TaxID=33877 RepID=UPI001E522235|nr:MULTISPECIES: GntR family transcriptional regulator [Agromyces]MCD1570770.1 GntR family transcriptional regulator [Agromyces mediolanus]GLU90965.1 GntR family transcriptional regulator [Agromyces sp. NBRC 114283]